MAKDPSASESHRSFTVRVPIATYLQMGQLAQDEGTNLNHKVNQLLLLGMGKHVSLDAALRRMVTNAVTAEGPST